MRDTITALCNHSKPFSLITFTDDIYNRRYDNDKHAQSSRNPVTSVIYFNIEITELGYCYRHLLVAEKLFRDIVTSINIDFIYVLFILALLFNVYS